MNKFLVLASFVVCISADIGIDLRSGAPTGSYLPQTTYNNVPHHSSSNYHGGSLPGGAGSIHVAQHRSFFFDAPEDLGETHVRVLVQPSAAAGNNVIYIKAPAYNSKIVPHFDIQQQQQSAGKTKVVVLVKKPEEQQDIVVPAQVQGPAAKPEVVFVKYSSQHEAEQKIQDIQHGSASGDIAKTVYNQQQLVSSIRDEPHHTHESSFGGFAVNSAPGVGGSSSGSHHHSNYGPAGVSGPY